MLVAVNCVGTGQGSPQLCVFNVKVVRLKQLFWIFWTLTNKVCAPGLTNGIYPPPCIWFEPFWASTINELKSGNLRLIKSDSIVSYLSAYSRKYNILNDVVELWAKRSEKISNLHNKMFDKTYYLLHEKDHPRTYPIKYLDISKDNIFNLKIELLSSILS